MKHTLLGMLLMSLAAGCAATAPTADRPLLRSAGAPVELAAGDISGQYRAGDALPVSVAIINTSPGPLQLSPHLDVIVRTGRDEKQWRVDLPLDGPIRLRAGGRFEWTLRLDRAVQLRQPGDYEVTLGHANSVSVHPGDWRGEVYLKPMRITLR